MSMTSGSSRRRRIAGERRPRGEAVDQAAPGAAPEAAPEAALQADPEAVESAVSLTTERRAAVSAPVSAPVPAAGAVDGSPAGGRWGSRPVVLVLAALLAVLLTLTALLLMGRLGVDGIGERDTAQQVEAARRTAPAVAERAAEAILVYDYRTLEADQKTAVGFMTDDFATTYSDTFTASVTPLAEETKAQVTAEVRGSSVVRAGDDTVRVLLFADQTTVSTVHQQPQVSLVRVEMTMVRRGDRWLVDAVSSY